MGCETPAIPPPPLVALWTKLASVRGRVPFALLMKTLMPCMAATYKRNHTTTSTVHRKQTGTVTSQPQSHFWTSRPPCSGRHSGWNTVGIKWSRMWSVLLCGCTRTHFTPNTGSHQITINTHAMIPDATAEWKSHFIRWSILAYCTRGGPASK